MPTVPGRKAAALTAGVSSDNSALLARAINSFWSHSKKTHDLSRRTGPSFSFFLWLYRLMVALVLDQRFAVEGQEWLARLQVSN